MKLINNMDKSLVKMVDEQLESVFRHVFDELPQNKQLWNALEISGWDSMSHMVLMVEIESEFGVHIPPARYLQCISYERIIELLISDQLTKQK